MKAEAFVARYRPGIGLSGVLLDNIAIILWVWIGDGIGENTETAVDGFQGGRWGAIYKRQREDTASSRLLQRQVTSYIILYWVEITGQRRTVCIRMICWIAPISLHRGVELDERRVTISFERVKGVFRVAKWARGHGPRFGQSEIVIETKEITISYLGNGCGLRWIIDSHRRQNSDLLSFLELIRPLGKNNILEW